MRRSPSRSDYRTPVYDDKSEGWAAGGGGWVGWVDGGWTVGWVSGWVGELVRELVGGWLSGWVDCNCYYY